MSREPLLMLLRNFEPLDERNAAVREEAVDFIEAHEDCLLRSCVKGHVTASGFVLNPQRDSFLLLHHRKLNRWLQPGGHADGDNDLIQVVLREVREETGVEASPLMTQLFDLDIHQIPARDPDPLHLHYDFRFVLEAKSEEIVVNQESFEAKWVPLQGAEKISHEPSILRMVYRWRTRESHNVAH